MGKARRFFFLCWGSRLLVWLLHVHAAHQQCKTDDFHQHPSCHDYTCSWQQSILRYPSNAVAPSPSCAFLVRDPEFLDILAFDSKLEIVAHADAHEGGVYFPDDDSFYFTSSKQLKPKPNAKIMKVFLETGKVETVKSETEVANGMVLDNKGSLLVCHQGIDADGGYVERLNLSTLETEIVADNWFGNPFNSPNDVIVKTDGSIWFTDPDYGWAQGFRKAPRLNNQVYRISPKGVVDAVTDGFVKPNGLAFSPDEKHLYVTDTGSTVGDEEGNVIISHPHSITVFDVEEDGAYLSNRRLFASIASMDGSYEGVGCPDGIKVDTMGRVYTSNPDGVQVLSPKGKVLGLIRVPGASNMGFAGPDLDQLIIMNGTAIYSVHLAARGAGLHYASS